MNLINGQQKEANNNQAYALAQQQLTSQQATQKADALQQQAQNQVKQDQNTVSSDFSQFDPNYYDNYRNAYTGYYTPQVADQYSQAQDQLTAALAGNGTLESSVGAQALANLAKRNTDQVAQIQSQADNAVTQQQQAIAGQQTALDNQANAGVDPTQIASNATAQTTALAAPQSYTPLGSVFSDLVTPFSNYTHSATNAPAQGYPIPQVASANGYNGGAGSPISTPG